MHFYRQRDSDKKICIMHGMLCNIKNDWWYKSIQIAHESCKKKINRLIRSLYHLISKITPFKGALVLKIQFFYLKLSTDYLILSKNYLIITDKY
jgi:hypothetical protein